MVGYVCNKIFCLVARVAVKIDILIPTFSEHWHWQYTEFSVAQFYQIPTYRIRNYRRRFHRISKIIECGYKALRSNDLFIDPILL